MKKIVQRTCIGCNNKKEKKELLRIVKNKNGEISVDETGKMPGRGIYICYNEQCLNKVIKTKKIEKVLQINLEDKFYNYIRGVIIEKNKKEKSN